MKKTLIYIIAAGALLTGGCKKFLEVKPEDKFLDEQVYGSEHGIQQALNGVYTNLTSNNLYGANLSTTTIEVVGQRYNVNFNSTNPNLLLYFYAYTDPVIQPIISNIWTAMYANILQDNQFIQQIDGAGSKGIIPAQKAAQLKGEAIGLRALMHFDMLRLFGPVYQTTPAGPSIPYYTKADGIARPILPASQAIDSVLADLNMAKALLANDPVITTGPNINLTNGDFYSSNRNQRLNYYAVVALMARVYLYKGDNINANAAAKLALTAIDAKFPWLPFDQIVGNLTPNRVFSTEVLFGLYNQNMYANYQTYFIQPAGGAAFQSVSSLPAYTGRLQLMFENNTNDYRFNTTWSINGDNAYCLKYADLSDPAITWRFLQPMVRKSELYYILAETEPDAANGINYLNTVRNNRGLANLPGTAVLTTELKKEYQKEFWGEGQLFYYYKRNNLTALPDATSTYAYYLSGSGGEYIFPLPLPETSPR